MVFLVLWSLMGVITSVSVNSCGSRITPRYFGNLISKFSFYRIEESWSMWKYNIDIAISLSGSKRAVQRNSHYYCQYFLFFLSFDDLIVVNNTFFAVTPFISWKSCYIHGPKRMISSLLIFPKLFLCISCLISMANKYTAKHGNTIKDDYQVQYYLQVANITIPNQTADMFVCAGYL